MKVLLRCDNGHEWEPSRVGGAVVPCPMCGSVNQTMFTPPTFPEARPPLPAAGEQSGPPLLSRYEILEEIGRGGMGVVYKARQRETGQIVALKILSRDRVGGSDLVGRFRREVQALSRLQHGGIVEIYEADEENGRHYLAMEYVPGITLHKLIELQGPLPVGLACEFIRQTALALQHADEQRLVHRDIKPANLMVVAPTGLPLPPRPVIKVLDMGVARLFHLPGSSEEMVATLTRDGSVIGTIDYIAPEQLNNPRGVDIRADLYSLGCTFYHLLAGRVPFPGDSFIDKLDAQRYRTAASVDQVRREIPRPVAALVRKLMSKEPDDRFQTPAELVEALTTLLRTGDLPGGHQPLELRCHRTLSGHTGNVTALAFLGDGKTLASGSSDKTLRLWDLETGQMLRLCGDGKQQTNCLAVAQGRLLAGQGVTIRLLDPTTGKETGKLTGHSDAVRCLAVSGDGKLLVSGSADRTIRLWDLHSSRELQRFGGHKGGINGVAISADGKIILSGSHDQGLRLWDSRSGREVRAFSAPTGPVLGVALTTEGQILSAHFDRTARLWDRESGRELRHFSGHRQMVAGIASLAMGRLISVSHDQTVRLWDGASGAELGCGQAHTGPIGCLAVASDGKTLATGSADQTVRLWIVPE